jgi:hypothetical protein
MKSMKSTRATPNVVTTTWVLLALLAGHDLSHALDDGLDTSVGALLVIAAPQWIALGVMLAIILRAQRQTAHLAAALLGLGVTVGLLVVHLLPGSAAPYADLDPSVVSWLLAWVPAVVGLVLVALALPSLRRSRSVAPSRGSS